MTNRLQAVPALLRPIPGSLRQRVFFAASVPCATPTVVITGINILLLIDFSFLMAKTLLSI
jgi:hypothetical protein